MVRFDTIDQATQWLRARVGAGSLRTDSRNIRSGDAFIAWPGAATDGRQYVATALQAGASCCLIEEDGSDRFEFDDDRIARIAGLKANSGPLAAAYYGQPSMAMDVVAVTGTNGKTSTAWWLAQAVNVLRNGNQTAQYACGFVGTLGMGLLGNMVSTGLTTPDPVMLQAELARLVKLGATACAMEASSIGLAEHRMAGTKVAVAIFTNFTQDHLDYHGSMQAYWLAKRTLFDMSGLKVAVINLDDAKSHELVAYCTERGLQVISTSLLRAEATLLASKPVYQGTGMAFDVTESGQSARVTCPVVGEYNVANMLGVIGALRALGVELKAACEALACCTPVPGRMDAVIHGSNPLLVVDYAHTPDALAKALTALRPSAQARGGKLWCVFGCGGNRDASKRPLMGQAAQGGADQIVLTSDNPRDESPIAIADQVAAGFAARGLTKQSIKIELDRQVAIRWAAFHAAPEDVILIAGKGHEQYQEIAGVKHPFSDSEQAKQALNLRTQGEAA